MAEENTVFEAKAAYLTLKAKVDANEKRLDKVEKRVQQNEAHSRQRNLRFYGLDYAKVQEEKDKERGIISRILEQGLKIQASRAKSIMNFIDIEHWTDSNKALIVAFSRRNDIKLMKKNRKNLATFKPYGKAVSMEDDLIKEHQEIKKNCLSKIKELKRDNARKNVKMVTYNKIAVGGTVKLWNEW